MHLRLFLSALSNLIFSPCVWGDTLLIACIWGAFFEPASRTSLSLSSLTLLPLSADVTPHNAHVLPSLSLFSVPSPFVVHLKGDRVGLEALHLDNSMSHSARELRGSFSSTLPSFPPLHLNGSLSPTASYRKVGQMPHLTLGCDHYTLCIHYTTTTTKMQ